MRWLRKSEARIAGPGALLAAVSREDPAESSYHLATLAALLAWSDSGGWGDASPLRITVVGGLAFSTAATLFLVPSLGPRSERSRNSPPFLKRNRSILRFVT